MKKTLLLTVFSACLGSGISGYAQSPSQEPAPPQPQQAQPQQQEDTGEPKTIVGCLIKGSGDHGYLITDKKSGEKLNFMASDKINQYLNQTVELSGRVMLKGGEKSFLPQTAKTVSPSCE